jgi:hypothetical protein
VLRDQLYPVKADNANRIAILDQDGKVLPGSAEVLGKENDIHSQEAMETLKEVYYVI